MNYTVLGSQIPHLSKETHKKASMTVHLTPLLLLESTEIRHPAPLLEGGGGWGRVGRGLGESGRGLEEGGRGLGDG